LINWEGFKQTLKQFIEAYGQDLVQTVVDQEGFMTKSDVKSLYTVIASFFI
jgi:intein-encoded DNA endonuclease-like protein